MGIDFNDVDEEAFQAFIASYPRKLERDVSTICEPPLVTWNDFERAPYWPDSVVASKKAGLQGGRVLSDINAPIPDNGKRDTDTPLTDSNGDRLSEGDLVSKWWGFSSVDGEVRRVEKILIRDKGTKYETYSFESCHNHARGSDMVKIKDAVS